jgi:hypothetical protein
MRKLRKSNWCFPSCSASGGHKSASAGYRRFRRVSHSLCVKVSLPVPLASLTRHRSFPFTSRYSRLGLSPTPPSRTSPSRHAKARFWPNNLGLVPRNLSLACAHRPVSFHSCASGSSSLKSPPRSGEIHWLPPFFLSLFVESQKVNPTSRLELGLVHVQPPDLRVQILRIIATGPHYFSTRLITRRSRVLQPQAESTACLIATSTPNSRLQHYLGVQIIIRSHRSNATAREPAPCDLVDSLATASPSSTSCARPAQRDQSTASSAGSAARNNRDENKLHQTNNGYSLTWVR